MAHNHTPLNDLIFHNQIVLPRSSLGFTEVALAVAELQGGNNHKAAAFAEAAVLKDPALAAGWLAKTAADVFEATPEDLRQDRALFCVDRALECAPACRREIVEFVVANIFGHYVEVLCASALAELTYWIEHETYAAELEHRAAGRDWQAAQAHGSAVLHAAAGLVTGMVALFSRRLGTRVFSGIVSVAAFSEAARLNRDAVVLEGMAAELRMAGYAQRLEGRGHRAASMFYLVPARDLVGVAARLLQAEGLPPQPLDRLIHAFTDGFRQVLSTHLHQLRQDMSVPMLAAIDGKPQGLVATYFGPFSADPAYADLCRRAAVFPVAAKEKNELCAGLNSLTQDEMRWLEEMLPGVRGLAAFQLLSRPMPTIAHWVYGFQTGTRFKSLPDRMEAADESLKVKTGLLTLVAIACFFFAPPLSLLAGAGVIYYVVKTKRRDRTRARVQDMLGSLWSADTWLRAPQTGAFNAPQVAVPCTCTPLSPGQARPSARGCGRSSVVPCTSSRWKT